MMKDTSITNKTKLLIVAGFAVALLLAVAVFGGGRKQPAATGSTAAETARGDVHGAAMTKSMSGATKLEFKTQPKQLKAGQPAIWLPKIFNTKTKMSVRSYETVRDHMMHLIVVSKDLSWFNHLFPEYKDHGLFVTRTVLPRAGTYKLFADYTPREGTREVTGHEFSVTGSIAAAPPSPLIADKVGKGNWIVREASSRREDEPTDQSQIAPRDAPPYQVALMATPSKLTAKQPVKLHFQIRDIDGKPLADLEPYLGAMGYAVIISSDGSTYVPAEPMKNGVADMKTHEPVVVFPTNFPRAGIYKVWGQFKHRGRIITAPFVLRVEADSIKPAMAKQMEYYCPMHPEITSNNPQATCSKCGGMKLVKRP